MCACACVRVCSGVLRGDDLSKILASNLEGIRYVRNVFYTHKGSTKVAGSTGKVFSHSAVENGGREICTLFNSGNKITAGRAVGTLSTDKMLQ